MIWYLVNMTATNPAFSQQITMIINEPVLEKTNNFGFPTRSDTNKAVQSQRRGRNLKFRIYEEEQVYYP